MIIYELEGECMGRVYYRVWKKKMEGIKIMKLYYQE